MSMEYVFKKVVAGEMTLEEFEEWCSEMRHNAYCEGASTQSYIDAVS